LQPVGKKIVICRSLTDSMWSFLLGLKKPALIVYQGRKLSESPNGQANLIATSLLVCHKYILRSSYEGSLLELIPICGIMCLR
jgi:hypothetical protein